MGSKTRKISAFLIFIFCLGASIAFMIIGVSRGVNSLNDLTELETNLVSIVAKRKKNSIFYDLKLGGFSNEFRIPADYESLFQYQNLIREISDSDTLYFAIDNKNLSQLNESETIWLLGIRTKESTYLDKIRTFEKDRITRKYIGPIGGIILILLSIGIYIYRRYYYRYDI